MNPQLNLADKQLILFDLDGTLVDSARDLYRAMNLSLDALGRALVTEAQIRLWVGKGASQLCYNVLAHQDEVVNPEQHHQLLDVFLDIYQKNVCVDSVVYEGVLAFLDACQQQGKHLACVTNKPYQPAIALLQALKIDQYFTLVLGGDSLAHRKPHPQPLLHAMRHFNQNVEHTLMIGDSRNDVEAARAAGIDCIVLSYGYNHGEDIQACQPQWVIDSLAELV